MVKTNVNLERLNRVKAKLDEYVELIRQLDELSRRKEELEADSVLMSLMASIDGIDQIAGESMNEESETEEIADEDPSGLIAKTREATVENLIRILDHGTLFDREKILELAQEAIPVWASKNDARSIGGALSSLARKGSIAVHRQAKVGPAGQPAVFRSPGPAEETTTQNHAENEGDSDNAETVTP